MMIDFSKPMIMGILNVTPDSFSDGGTYQNIDEIIQTAKQMVLDGASIIDVGGESTRPNASVVEVEEELRRVIPVIKRLREEVDVLISIDTYKAIVAKQAVEAGAHIINDISGSLLDEEMPHVMAQSNAYVILMHNRLPDVSKTKCLTVVSGEVTQYNNLIEDVKSELKHCIERVKNAGVSEEKIILDPGIGFSKTIDQNITLLKEIDRLHELGYPILLGVSKKGTIGALLGGATVENRKEGTLATTCFAVTKNINIIRVHDVLENVRCLNVMTSLWS